MARAGLRPVKKTVTRGGTTYEQTYYVREADLRKKIEEGDTDGAVKEAGGDQKLADAMTLDWRLGADQPAAVSLRVAFVRDIAGYSTKNDIMRIANKRAFRSGNTPAEEVRNITARWTAFGGPGRRNESVATASAMARVSQSMYDTDTVTLYRGVSGDQADKLKPGKVSLGVNHLSSFTESRATAERFALYGKKKGALGRVVKVQVPRSAIAVSHRAFSNLSDEKEVLVLSSGSIEGRVLDEEASE